MATKKLERRQFQNSRFGIYHCLTFDVTEEIQEMFGVPIKEAFAVYKKTTEDRAKFEKDFWDNPPKTIEVSDCLRGGIFKLTQEISVFPKWKKYLLSLTMLTQYVFGLPNGEA